MRWLKTMWERETDVAIVRVLEGHASQDVEIEYKYNEYPDNRTTYPLRSEGALLFDLPERVTDELREAVLAAFDWMDEQKEHGK